MSEFGHKGFIHSGICIDSWGAGPYILTVAGKAHRFEDSDRFGPNKINLDGSIPKNEYWSERHPFWRAHLHRRKTKARRKMAPGHHAVADVVRIRASQKDKCAYCRANLKGKGHLDHITALAKGGTNNANNLQFLCEPCNVSKRADDPIDFAKRKWLLI